MQCVNSCFESYDLNLHIRECTQRKGLFFFSLGNCLFSEMQWRLFKLMVGASHLKYSMWRKNFIYMSLNILDFLELNSWTWKWLMDKKDKGNGWQSLKTPESGDSLTCFHTISLNWRWTRKISSKKMAPKVKSERT